MPVARKRRRITGWDVWVLVAANAVAVVGLWWRQGGIREIHDLAGLLTSLGRVTGLLVAHTVLITAGYALDDGVSLTRETDELLTRYSGVLLATIGLGLLVVVVVSSVV